MQLAVYVKWKGTLSDIIWGIYLWCQAAFQVVWTRKLENRWDSSSQVKNVDFVKLNLKFLFSAFAKAFVWIFFEFFCKI